LTLRRVTSHHILLLVAIHLHHSWLLALRWHHVWLLALRWHHAGLLHVHHAWLTCVHHRRAIVDLHVGMVVRGVHAISLVCVPSDTCVVVSFLCVKLSLVVFLLLLIHLFVVPFLLLSHGSLLLGVDVVQLKWLIRSKTRASLLRKCLLALHLECSGIVRIKSGRDV